MGLGGVPWAWGGCHGPGWGAMGRGLLVRVWAASISIRVGSHGARGVPGVLEEHSLGRVRVAMRAASCACMKLGRAEELVFLKFWQYFRNSGHCLWLQGGVLYGYAEGLRSQSGRGGHRPWFFLSTRLSGRR